MAPHYIGLDPSLSSTHWRKRVQSFTWALFTVNMGTSGLYDLLYLIPYRFEGLIVLGDIVLILNIVLFVIFVAGLAVRFISRPRTFVNSILHPFESCFVPTFPLAIATLDSGFVTYAKSKSGVGFWIVTTCEVIFWIYLAIAFLCALTVPLIQFQAQRHPLPEFSPLWMLPALGVIFAGFLAYDISTFLPAYSSIYMIVTGYVCIGFGFFVALLYSAGYLVRMISFGIMAPKLIPFMFIAVGPVSWAAAGMIALGDLAVEVFPVQSPPFAMSPMSGLVFSEASLMFALMLWGFAWWLLMIAILQMGYTVIRGRYEISLGIWSITFPTAGHVTTTLLLGKKLDSRFLNDLGIVQFFIYLLFWLGASGVTLFGIWRGQILAEGVDVNAPQVGFMGDFEDDEDEAEKGQGGQGESSSSQAADQSSPSRSETDTATVH